MSKFGLIDRKPGNRSRKGEKRNSSAKQLVVMIILGLVLNRKNILMIIISIELTRLSVNLNFIIFSVYLDDILGQLFVLFILTVAACEKQIP